MYIALTFAFYVRTALEVFQFATVSSINEIRQFDTHSSQRVTSLACAFVVLAACVLIVVFAGYVSLSNYTLFVNRHNKLGQLFVGLKPDCRHRSYVAVSLVRKAVFVCVLVAVDVVASRFVVGAVAIAQLVYIAYVVKLRPFDEVAHSVVEIINEAYFA